MTPQNDTHQRLHINRKEILNLNPMDKIKLRLCAGTMCYVMGGAQLMEIEELLSEEEKPVSYTHLTLPTILLV